MPLFLDLHKIQSTAKDGRRLFPEDKRWKNKNGCLCISSWIDLQKNQVVRIFDAPGKNELKKLLNEKHKPGSHEIVPVNSKVAEVFLERLEQVKVPGQEKSRFSVFKNEAEFKVFLVVYTDDPFLLRYRLGEKDFSVCYPRLLRIMGNSVCELQGREILRQKDFCVSSFFSVYNALKCAVRIKKKCSSFENVVRTRLVLVPGEFTGGDEFDPFSHFYFYEKKRGKIIVASRIHKICRSTGESGLNGSDFACLTTSEEKLLKLLMKVLNQNWQNPKFDCRAFCSKVALSKASLYRKCTATTGRSPNALIKEYRLLKALNLLKKGQSITRTGYDTGFSSPSYFSRCFRQQFGIKPVVYRKFCERLGN